MRFKKRFYIGTILSLVLGTLSFWTKDRLPIDYFYFSMALISLIGTYLTTYYIVQVTGFKSYWSIKTDKKIVFFTAIGVLLFGINMSNKIDEELPSFWVVNGNRWLTDVFASLIALIFAYVIFSWVFKQWKNIQTLKKDKSIAELALLKNQINPHFFFNTLNNLYSLIKSDPDTAQEYVLKLSDMMRFTIYKGKEEMVGIQDEVNYLTNFIELQTARYHKKIEIDFQQNIENKETSIPPLLFIILLENAFKHGVESLVDNAFIHIKLTESENGITFSIQNNFDLDELSKTKGIGLKNLKDRLHLLYPNTHNLTFKIERNTYLATLKLDKK